MASILEALGIEPGAIVVNIIGFLLLLYLLRRYAFGPIGEFMQQRADGIAADLREAEQERTAAAAERQNLQQQLDAMRETFRADIARASREAKQAIADLHAEARTQRQQMVAQGAEELRRAREAMLAELKQQVAAMAIEVASKVVRDALDEERHRAVIDAFIADVNRIAHEMPEDELAR